MSGAMVYKWRPQAGIKINAKIAGEHLEKLRVRHNGKLTPRAVLEDAKSRTSPLHKAFEWSETKAATEYRLWQARHIVNSLIVVVRGGKDAKTDDLPKRAFVSVRREKGRDYTSRADALTDAELRAQMVEQAIRELVSWRDRNADLSELASVHKLVDQLARGLKKPKVAA